MAIEIDPLIVETWRASHGAPRVRFENVAPDDAIDAMKAARAAVGAFPHPEEPDDPLPSWVGDIEIVRGGAEFGFDAGDTDVFEGVFEALAASVAAAIEGAGVTTGRLTAPVVQGEDVGIPQAVLDAFVGEYPAGWFSGLTVPEPHSAVFAEATNTDWELRVSVQLTVGEILEFYEHALPTAGFHITGAMESSGEDDAVACIFFVRGADAGQVVVYRFDAETFIGVEGYAARTSRDTLWTSKHQALPPGWRWRVRPNWP